MSVKFELDYSETNNLVEMLKRAEDSERTVNDVLHQYAPEKIKVQIQKLLPTSGRTWSGKATPAAGTQPFTEDTRENLSVTIKSRKPYHYLYFPDDGSNTKRHEGGQDFMGRGLQTATPDVTDKLVEELIKTIGGN